ncbi:MAG: hypothetical protein KA173_06115 [Rhodoferax sp.]|nr:hypothetical protein [Rhodoferax sp.]MBP7492521.1 hypothetical protein [Rhodoferax sp.]
MREGGEKETHPPFMGRLKDLEAVDRQKMMQASVLSVQFKAKIEVLPRF